MGAKIGSDRGACAALLEANPHPSAGDVTAALAGHLCRCGSNPCAIEAVLDVARAGKAAKG